VAFGESPGAGMQGRKERCWIFGWRAVTSRIHCFLQAKEAQAWSWSRLSTRASRTTAASTSWRDST
jgi:hypothetical protein